MAKRLSEMALEQKNEILSEKLREAHEQIKLLGAVLQIVNEDLCVKNEQLAHLYADLKENPIWQDIQSQHTSSKRDDDGAAAASNEDEEKKGDNGNESELDLPVPLPPVPIPIAMRSISSEQYAHSLMNRGPLSDALRDSSLHPASCESMMEGFGSADLFEKGPLAAILEASRLKKQCKEKNKRMVGFGSADLFGNGHSHLHSPPSGQNAGTPRARRNGSSSIMANGGGATSASGGGRGRGPPILMRKRSRSMSPDLSGELNGSAKKRMDKTLKELKSKRAKKEEKIDERVFEPISTKAEILESTLPVEVALWVLTFLNFDDLIAMSRLSTHWRMILNDDALWRHAFENRYGKKGDRFKQSKQQQTRHKKTWKESFHERMYVERVWKQSRSRVMTLCGHNGSITALKFHSKSGRLVTASDDGSIIQWHLGLMKRRGHFESSSMTQENESSESSSHASSVLKKMDYRKYLQKRNVRRGKWLAERSNKTLMGLQKKSSIQVNHHKSNANRLKLKKNTLNGHAGPVWCVDMDLNGDRQILASGAYDKTVKIWGAKTGHCVHTVRAHDEWVSAIKVADKSGGGFNLLSSSWDASIKAWQWNESEINRACRGDLESNSNNFEMECVVTLRGQPGNAIYCLDWKKASPNIVVSGCRHASVCVWDLEKGEMIREMEGHSKHVYALKGPQNEWMPMNCVMSGSADRSIRLWDLRGDLKSDKGCTVLNGHDGPVMCLEWDDFKVISAGYDKCVKIWDLRMQREMQSLYGHSKVIFALQFDNQSNQIVTGSADKRVLVTTFQ